jgi:hypothetical protein
MPPTPYPDSVRVEPAQQERRRGLLVPILLGILLVAVVGLQLWQIGPISHGGSDASKCTPDSSDCFDSGWQPVSNSTSAAFIYRHRLGVTPRGITAWFSPTADGVRAFALVWNFPRPEAGNPVTIEARPDAIIINIWGGAPIHGIYDGTNETWTTFNQGFYRIVATK